MYNTKTKKQLTLAIIVIVLLMVLTGTYAWSSFNQRAFAPAWDIARGMGGRIHVHYDNEYNIAGDDFNKAIFAENFGEKPIFVRVRLMEFASFNGLAVIEDMNVETPTSWEPFRFDPSQVDGRNITAGRPGAEQIATLADWVLGDDAGNERMVFMPTFNQISVPATDSLFAAQVFGSGLQSPFDTVHIAQMTEASGAAVDAIATGSDPDPAVDDTDRPIWAEPNSNNASDPAIRWGSGMQTAVGRAADEPNDGSLNFWQLDEEVDSLLMRIATEDDENDTVLYPGVVEGDIVVELATHTAQETIAPMSEVDLDVAATDDIWANVGDTFNDGDFRGIMTLSQWNALGQPEGDFWIYDDHEDDGWFYWNGFIVPGEDDVSSATSRLLESISITAPSNGAAWEYVIEVDSDFFSEITLLDPENRVMHSLMFEPEAGEDFSPVMEIFTNAIEAVTP